MLSQSFIASCAKKSPKHIFLGIRTVTVYSNNFQCQQYSTLRKPRSQFSSCHHIGNNAHVPVSLSYPFLATFSRSESTASPPPTPSVAPTDPNYIPAPPTPSPTVEVPVEEVVSAIPLNALGEPALSTYGLGSWWPPGLVQHVLEFLHASLGIPWWGSIAILVFTVRLCLTPLVIKSQKTATRLANNGPAMMVIQTKMQEARQEGNMMLASKYANDLAVFMREKQLNPLSTMLPQLLQAPVFISCFFGLRAMANAPVESLKTGGALWFMDLTVPDPFCILPLMMCGTLYIMMEISLALAPASLGKSALTGYVMKYVMRGIPIVLFPIGMNFPSAILVYWTTTNLFSFIQLLILRIPRVRKYLNIEERMELEEPDELKAVKKKGIIRGIREAWQNQKIAAEISDRHNADEIRFRNAGKGPVPKTFSFDPTKQRKEPVTRSLVEPKQRAKAAG